jgi:nitronate monooxygenase
VRDLPGIPTTFTEMLNIKYPIIGAPMFLVSYEDLAIAVSEAGGLGTIPLPNYRTTRDLEKAFINIKNRTNKPIGVNIHLSGKFDWEKQLEICLEADVKFFITSLGDPRLIIDEVHQHDGLIFADVVNLEQALKAKEKGVDGLIAVGYGAGGHGGSVSTLVFVPWLKAKVGLPVIAAGGISTGPQLAAALVSGACAAIVGTRLIATPESRASEDYKNAVVSAGPGDIVFTDRITGNVASWLASSIENMEEKLELGSKRWLNLWSAGQSVAQTSGIQPAKQIIEEIVRDYRAACDVFLKSQIKELIP